MDANKKPQMTREMIMRLSGPSRRSVDGFKAYGDTGRMLAANRSVNSERRYVKGYGSSISANNSDNRRRFGAEISVVSRSRVANNNPDDVGLSGGNRRVNSIQNNNVPSDVNNSRQSFNANRTTFREPPSRGYNPFG
ncbi:MULTISPECIES: hypothetical protein [unclassified Candidatus Nanosynbacter]|uniref:hypothetical protein n=1 Tax=unclassified Candidatus Nanosynbacter TaxID=2725944 RepID=UPI001FB597D8|nr:MULTISPECIES: hypothetical protein [unclassified Candidatus Nanosynbacter]MCJ1963495.1 hypothetical protein [Candidatus Nanosynbacter sp. TM7-033]UOG67982.1 hypothetical protein LRM46_00415 [Candidatus Nanosynbacter sp. HMT-352]